jgi:hypothetical protein
MFTRRLGRRPAAAHPPRSQTSSLGLLANTPDSHLLPRKHISENRNITKPRTSSRESLDTRTMGGRELGRSHHMKKKAETNLLWCISSTSTLQLSNYPKNLYNLRTCLLSSQSQAVRGASGAPSWNLWWPPAATKSSSLVVRYSGTQFPFMGCC